MFQPFQTLQVQLLNQLFSIIHSENFTLFNILFYSFTLQFLFKIYNYNCTIPILQLQTTFYKCTNFHQLHVKMHVSWYKPTNANKMKSLAFQAYGCLRASLRVCMYSHPFMYLCIRMYVHTIDILSHNFLGIIFTTVFLRI